MASFVQFMRLLAPAKINLHLRVAPADGSGFHPLLSWMCTIALFDTLMIEPCEPGRVLFNCDDSNLPRDENNLVIKAVTAMRREIAQETPGMQVPGVKIHLQKRLPVGGGLGGGSSNAACVLLTLNRLWNLHWPIERLARIGAILGSDVPFFLHGPSSVCAGRGEKVMPVSRPASGWAVLILPGFAISTAAVYEKFDELRLGDRSSIENEPAWQQWAELSAGPLLSRLVNDLEIPAFAISPQLCALRSQIEQSLGRIVRMSGSGSSLFTLYDTRPEAQAAVDGIVNGFAIQAVAVETAPELE